MTSYWYYTHQTAIKTKDLDVIMLHVETNQQNRKQNNACIHLSQLYFNLRCLLLLIDWKCKIDDLMRKTLANNRTSLFSFLELQVRRDLIEKCYHLYVYNNQLTLIHHTTE